MFKGQVNRNQLQTEIPLNIHLDSFVCCNTISKVISERQKRIKIDVKSSAEASARLNLGKFNLFRCFFAC